MLRKYQQEDIKAIVELEHMHLDSSLEASYYEADLKNPLAYHYVWEEQGKIIGFISSVFDGVSLEILNFVVHRSFQSMGYGTKIFSTLLDELVLKDLNQVSLEVKESNLKAIFFYQKFGFKEIRVRKAYYPNHENALVLQKLYDTKKDIINLEAILFSLKEGLKYYNTSENDEAFNHYDLYDEDVSVLDIFMEDSSFAVWTNQQNQEIFLKNSYTSEILLHTNAYSYQYACKKEAILGDYKYIKNQNGKKWEYCLFIGGVLAGALTVLEYHHSLLLSKIIVEEQIQKSEIIDCLMNAMIKDAKVAYKTELYIKLNCLSPYYREFENRNFKPLDTFYKVKKVI